MTMIKTYRIAFRLKNTYRVNGFLFFLRQLPVLKKFLSGTLFASPGLKILANIVAVIQEIGSAFIGKILYFALMYLMVAAVTGRWGAEPFFHIFLFLTILGGLLNTHMFNPTKDKYYAIFLMRMDARSYALANYIYFLIKSFVGFLVCGLVFGILCGMHPLYTLAVPVMAVSIKIILCALLMWDSLKHDKTVNENLPTKLVWILVAVLLAAAYVPVFLNFIIPLPVFWVFLVGSGIGAVPAFIYLWTCGDYRKMYKELLGPDNIVFDSQQKAQQVVQAGTLKQIDVNVAAVSHKKGYAYFNDLFIQRHGKILKKYAQKVTVVLSVLVGATVGVCLIRPEISAVVNTSLMAVFPTFLFLMYMINAGGRTTQVMFMNCDHSMLTYRFYRQPKAILFLFTQRLKSIVKINLMPTSVIALGLPLILWVSGGTDQGLYYMVLFVSIMVMSVFFSVHYLVLYYLLQPYNAQLESKSPAYTVINILTYWVCYLMIGKKIAPLVFGGGLVAFCGLYIVIALILAYRFAPKTFKLR